MEFGCVFCLLLKRLGSADGFLVLNLMIFSDPDPLSLPKSCAVIVSALGHFLQSRITLRSSDLRATLDNG